MEWTSAKEEMLGVQLKAPDQQLKLRHKVLEEKQEDQFLPPAAQEQFVALRRVSQ